MQYIAVQLLHEEDSVFTPLEFDPISGRPIISHITYNWIDSFLSRFYIVLHKQFGSLSRSPSHTLMAEKSISYHLGCLKRNFVANFYDENLVESMDETYFTLYMDD